MLERPCRGVVSARSRPGRSPGDLGQQGLGIGAGQAGEGSQDHEAQAQRVPGFDLLGVYQTAADRSFRPAAAGTANGRPSGQSGPDGRPEQEEPSVPPWTRNLTMDDPRMTNRATELDQACLNVHAEFSC